MTYVCPIPDCEICRATKRRDARAKMTKPQLRADADAADEAYMDASEWHLMEKVYREQLERHLVIHGCSCDLGAVAGEPERIHIKESA